VFTRIARAASTVVAHPAASLLAIMLFAAWVIAVYVQKDATAELLAGGATVGTLMIVLLLQHAQYHDTRALHAKIDELILSLEGPRDELAGVERRDADELDEIPRESGEERPNAGPPALHRP
jgi:low affinity Fe/Cu permease